MLSDEHSPGRERETTRHSQSFPLAIQDKNSGDRIVKKKKQTFH
jgi:hypothetical protein